MCIMLSKINMALFSLNVYFCKIHEDLLYTENCHNHVFGLVVMTAST